jgi:undecaprenyl-diphosphatase
MELFTLVGQPPFTVGIAAAVWGYGWALGKPFYMLAGMIAIVAIAMSGIIKVILHRARPVNEYVAKMLFLTYSFPSGHAAGSIVSFGLAALVVSYRWPELAVMVWIVAALLTLCVSLSRIYLGAHYASDIIGGWVVGGLGLVAILLIDK